MYKHKLKKRVFQNGYYRDVIVHTNARLGSDLLDKHGHEIFEGNKVKDNYGNEYTATFRLVFVDRHCNELNKDADYFKNGELEIIGHDEN